MKSERIHWIDIARGIGIIFVIYAHVLGSYDFRHLIYAFHMPLFFFLSGVVYNADKYISFVSFLNKNFKHILIPYFIFAFLTFPLWLIRLENYNIFSFQILKQFLSIFYANSNNGLMAFNNILWFLPALFVTKILFGFLNNLFKNLKLLFLILLLISIFGYLVSIFLPFLKLPLGAETAITGVVFYGLGFLWFGSEKAKKIVTKNKYILFPLLLIFGGILSNIDFNYYGHQIDMRLNHLNNYFFFYISAISGIYAWISFSIILNKNRLLEILGKNSLILFVWHPIAFYYIREIQDIILDKQILQNIKMLIPAIYTFCSISVILSLNLIYKKFKLFFINLFPKPNSQ